MCSFSCRSPIYLIFVAIPYFTSMLVSFTKWRGLSMNITFNGLNNYIKLFNDPHFWNALSHNAIALVVLPPVIILSACSSAFLFTQGIRGGGFFRIAFFFPQVMSVIIVAVLWSFIYHPTIGMLNGVIGRPGHPIAAEFPLAGRPGHHLRCHPGGDRLAGGRVSTWCCSSPAWTASRTDFYEAAKIDGANSWMMFWRMTVPMLWEAIRTPSYSWRYRRHGYVSPSSCHDQRLSGGPSRAADVVPTILDGRQPSKHGEWGYATAMAVVLMLI